MNSLLYRILMEVARNDTTTDENSTDIHYKMKQSYSRTVFTFKHIGNAIQLLFESLYPHKFSNKQKFIGLTKFQTKQILISTV